MLLFVYFRMLPVKSEPRKLTAAHGSAVSPALFWPSIGEKHQALTGGRCECDGNLFACASRSHCLAQITPEQVLAALKIYLPGL
jgi:hypothetical protein